MDAQRPGVEGRRQAPAHLLETQPHEDRRHADVDQDRRQRRVDEAHE